jgi:catechol 2,3-dioxygenase-like lactoylglutathione lyase family enzyme
MLSMRSSVIMCGPLRARDFRDQMIAASLKHPSTPGPEAGALTGARDRSVKTGVGDRSGQRRSEQSGLSWRDMEWKRWILGLCAVVAWAQAANHAANQSGIAHAAFRVADLEAARGFYNKLGFEQFFEMKQGERTTEAFIKINDRQFIELYPRTDPLQALGLMHVCYESSDLEALHSDYVKRGLTVSDVRKAGAGNLLMTMKDPEGQTIEYTQYMPGSRHFEDRGKHLGANRVSTMLTGATAPARDASAIRGFYMEKLSFTEIGHGVVPVRLRMPGDSGQELDIAGAGPEVKSGIQFRVADLKQTAAVLTGLGLQAKSTPASVTVADPDGVVISFVK